jgi:hypothetical protein
MLPIEQVFYQIRLHSGTWTAQRTAATNTVSRADQDEMADWFSGTAQELALRCDPFNLFFHPLPSGRYALGIIYSARRSFLTLFQPPQTLNVRILVVSPTSLLEHGNHPIALFETLRHRHQIPFVSQPPTHLAPLIPAASPPQINVPLLENLVQRLGAMALAQLTQSLFIAECTLFTSKSVSALSVLSALFDLLPIPYRPELTFSSDFLFSSKNSFRLSGFSRLQQRTIRLMKQWGVPVISLEQGNKGSVETLDPWARFVYQLLQTQNFNFLEQYRNTARSAAMLLPMESPLIVWDNLHEVGVELSKAMVSRVLPDKFISATEVPNQTLEGLRCVAAVDQMLPMLPDPQPNTVRLGSDRRLGEQFPQFREELSELEVYLVRGMFGDEAALPNIKRVWSQLLPRLDTETRESVRETIIASIHAVLSSLGGDAGQRLHRSSQLLELMVFFLNRGTH